MIWNNDKYAYFGTTTDEKTVRVDGDEWSESLEYGIQSYIDNQSHVDLGGETFDGKPTDLLEQNPSLYEKYENLTLIELNDPNMWAGLVGSNQNVEFVEE